MIGILITLACLATVMIAALFALQSRNAGPILGLVALVIARVVYSIPGVRKPAELRIAACIKTIRPLLAAHAPLKREHRTKRAKRDGHLQVSFIVARDSELGAAADKHDVVLTALRNCMREHGFTEKDVAELRVDFVSSEQIERCGGAFHYWREHGVE